MINDSLGFNLSRNGESSGPNHGVACLHGLMSYVVNSPSRKSNLSKSPPSRLSKSTRRVSWQPSWHAIGRRSRRSKRESRGRQRVRGFASVLHVAGCGSRLFCKLLLLLALLFFLDHIHCITNSPLCKINTPVYRQSIACLALVLFSFVSPTRKRQAVQNIG
jgi:hypothetical protein